MKITVIGFLTFLSSLCFVFGFWQFLWVIIHRKGFEMDGQEGESFPDFLFRYYEDDVFWKLRKRFMPKWFYYSKMFLFFVKLKGVMLITSGTLIAVGIFLLSKSEYAQWLQIQF